MKIPNFTIVTFVTENTPYVDVYYKYLFPSVQKFNLPIITKFVPNRNSWLKNVAYKPEIILELLEEGIDNIVFLDADAEIISYPELFDTIPKEYDIAVHFLNWFLFYGHSPGKKELLSGSLYLRNNDKVKALVKDWLLNVQRNLNVWEQQILEEVLQKLHKDINIYELPISYCWIKTLPNGNLPRIKCDNPFIIHHQTSRKLKKIIGR